MVFFIVSGDAHHPLDNATYTLHVLTCQTKNSLFYFFFEIDINPACLLAILSFTGLFCVRGYHGFGFVSRKKRQKMQKFLIASLYAVFVKTTKKILQKNLTGGKTMVWCTCDIETDRIRR